MVVVAVEEVGRRSIRLVPVVVEVEVKVEVVEVVVECSVY
jgi:hypothetical protein